MRSKLSDRKNVRKLVYSLDKPVTDYTSCYLIDDRIAEASTFSKNPSNSSLPILYNSRCTKTELTELLEKLVNLTRIACVFEGNNLNDKRFLDEKLFFTNQDLQNKTNLSADQRKDSENCEYLRKLPSKITNLDFLACNTLLNPDWKKFYALLPQTIGASDDKTGNLKQGGDWVLESTQQDVRNIYFGVGIQQYQSTLDVTNRTPVKIISHCQTIHASDIPTFTSPNQFAFLIKGTKPITVKLANDFTTIADNRVFFVVDSDNVTIIGCKHTQIQINTPDYRGLIRNGLNTNGWNNLTIKHITISAASTGSLASYSAWILNNSLSSYNNSQNTVVKYCTNNAPIDNYNCAGIVFDGTNTIIRRCKNTGNMTDENCGGIVNNYNDNNYAANCAISKCHNSGNMSDYNCGGIACNLYYGSFIADCKNTGNMLEDAEYSGGIVSDADNNSTITKCHNSGSMATYDCGGIVSYLDNNSTVTNCKNTGNMLSGADSSGGIAGNADNKSTVSKCCNSGSMADDNCGGIVGYVDNGSSVTDCKNTGNMLSGANNSGGIARYVEDNSTISKCCNSGSMAASECGGIASELYRNATIRQCRNTGDMLLGSDASAGIVYLARSGSIISECINDSDIKDQNCGGIVALGTNMKIINCYSIGKLFTNSYGIIANLDGTGSGIQVSNCYVASKRITGQNPITGIPSTVEGVIYFVKCSKDNDANGNWSDRRANKYLLGTDGTVWRQNNGKPYKLAKH
jgi:hypothetical protein